MKLLCLPFALIFALSCSGGDSGLHDGYYTAEAARFDSHGWKEFVTICVRNSKIITIEYNAKNPSGFIKSWDMDYMRHMSKVEGTYPNEYTRIYASRLLDKQNPEELDVVTGATESYEKFKQLASAVISQAKAGDTHVAAVEIIAE
ncbi:MAG: FMN-binding protein [Spirochaetales bacterium]|jgi:major membrane immunogen (membrane-anchored lipoprotein)|nr:FMN-binding protein [Spirochaetales bacterium]